MNNSNLEFLVERIIRKAHDGISLEEIYSNFSKSNYDNVDRILDDYVSNYRVLVDNGNYIHIDNTNYRVGTYRQGKNINRFVQIGNDNYGVNYDGLAIDGDTVLVDVLNKKSKLCNVVNVLDRNIDNIFGEIVMVKDKYYLEPENEKYKKLVIELNDVKSDMVGAKVVCNLANVDGNNYNGDVDRIIGFRNSPNIDIKTAAYKFGIDGYFRKDVLDEAERVELDVSDVDKIGRCDLTKKEIFTIDGDDTKDIDDAISLEMLDNGNYLLGVHIADVTHYVKEGSFLDKEALRRSTSSYLCGTVIPMYPSILSNGICSLNPGVDRLAMSCEMEIDKYGNVVRSNIFESVIKSNIQMTYKKVNDILNNNIVASGYEKHESTLRNMFKLSLILKKKRLLKGSIEMEIPEVKIGLDDNGKPVSFVRRENGNAENLIEEFMIVCNESVAKALEKYPTVYRVHDIPDTRKVNDFVDMINALGIKYSRCENMDYIRQMQSLCETLKSSGELGKSLMYSFLHILKKASYSVDNIGHFALASKNYLHFTSPIRRYADDTVHRSVKKYLLSDGKVSEEDMFHDFCNLDDISGHISFCEKNADRCERVVNAMKMAEYMENHIGEEFVGRVTSIDKGGMTILLDNMIEGRIRIDDLDTCYLYNGGSYYLESVDGKSDNYYYGDLIQVKLIDASKERKNIDFVPVKLLERSSYVDDSLNLKYNSDEKMKIKKLKNRNK